MTQLYERPDWVRRLNYFGPATGSARHVVPLDPDELLDLARSSTGLADIGDDLFVDGFRHRLRSIDEESNAHVVGRLLARAEAVRVLQTRLRLRDTWARNPEILDEPIAAPIFVVGPPRTGTSIMLELLALDPALRAPIAWEAHHPLPGERASGDPTERMRWAEAEQEMWADIQPEFMTVHELRHDLPCECIHFQALDFTAGYWGMHYATPSYDLWASEHPEITARGYADHRRFLQTLQWLDRQAGRTSAHWLLKTPGHLATLPQLFAEYPDALIVATHRDPMKWVASAASTTAMLRWLRSDTVDTDAQGVVAQVGFRFMADGVIAGRADGSLPDDRFVDSHFSDLMAAPASAIRSIYDKLSLPWPDGHDATIESYLRDKPKGKFGKHEYTFEQYGMDPEAVRADYAAYVAHYGIVEET